MSPQQPMIRKLIPIVLVLMFSVSVVFAQTKYSDRCTVAVVEITGKKLSDLDSDRSPNLKQKELGTFDTVIGEEELTTRSYRLPKTKLFVVASVWYTDESMAGASGRDSMSLQLEISRTSKHQIPSALQFAEAEVLSFHFEVARVTTIFKTQQRSFYIVMECRKHNGP